MKHIDMKKYKVFYGWWIVSAITLISAYVIGVVNWGFTAAFEPIANEFRWSYAKVSFAASIRGLQGGLLTPLVGFLFDRWGPRRWIFAGVIITGLGLFLLSRINALTTFYGAAVLIALGFSCCTGLVTAAVIGNWFRKRVGLATGIAISGGCVGGLCVPLVTRLIDVCGWRDATAILGLGMLVICLPLSLLVRHKPEQYGYLPDGEMNRGPVAGEDINPAQSTEVVIGVKQALKSRGFWHVAFAMMFHMMPVNAVVVHVMPYLSAIDVARSTASLVAMAIPLISILGMISFGWFTDRFDRRWIGAIACALTGLGVFLFAYIGDAGIWLFLIFPIIFGIGLGGFVPVLPTLQREYFGRVRLGTILGLTSGVGLIGTILGPPLAGWIFDSWGSYQYAWFVLTVVPIIGTVILLTAPAAGGAMPVANELRNRGDAM